MPPPITLNNRADLCEGLSRLAEAGLPPDRALTSVAGSAPAGIRPAFTRAAAMVAKGTDDATLSAMALADDGVQRALGGKEPRRVIVIKGRLVNVVG